jgi:hypothetical protein
MPYSLPMKTSSELIIVLSAACVSVCILLVRYSIKFFASLLASETHCSTSCPSGSTEKCICDIFTYDGEIVSYNGDCSWRCCCLPRLCCHSICKEKTKNTTLITTNKNQKLKNPFDTPDLLSYHTRFHQQSSLQHLFFSESPV